MERLQTEASKELVLPALSEVERPLGLHQSTVGFSGCQQDRNERISALTYHLSGPHATYSLACLPITGQLQQPAEFAATSHGAPG